MILPSFSRTSQYLGFAPSWSPNRDLVLILPPGLREKQVEAQDFVSNEEIVNPALGLSCCFVFIRMVLTTASSRGGWERRDKSGPAACII